MTAFTPASGASEVITADQPECTVAFENVSLYYGEYRAVKDVNLLLPARAITAIIGPSGSGKSTVLRAVNRINDKVSIFRVGGRILVGGVDIYAPGTDPVMLRQQVGMVFQRPNPFPMSIYDNVAFGHSARPVCGMRSKTSCASPDRGSPAASSSACVSPVPSRRSRTCC
jgi:phosphate transport system ATP-binding protein